MSWQAYYYLGVCCRCSWFSSRNNLARESNEQIKKFSNKSSAQSSECSRQGRHTSPITNSSYVDTEIVFFWALKMHTRSSSNVKIRTHDSEICIYVSRLPKLEWTDAIRDEKSSHNVGIYTKMRQKLTLRIKVTDDINLRNVWWPRCFFIFRKLI